MQTGVAISSSSDLPIARAGASHPLSDCCSRCGMSATSWRAGYFLPPNSNCENCRLAPDRVRRVKCSRRVNAKSGAQICCGSSTRDILTTALAACWKKLFDLMAESLWRNCSWAKATRAKPKPRGRDDRAAPRTESGAHNSRDAIEHVARRAARWSGRFHENWRTAASLKICAPTGDARFHSCSASPAPIRSAAVG